MAALNPQDNETMPDDLRHHERRESDQRVDRLERNYERLQNAVQRVEAEIATMGRENGFIREMLKSNFNALDSGQKLLSDKIDRFFHDVQTMSTDVDRSAAGRAVMRELQIIRQEQQTALARLMDHEQAADERMKQVEECVRVLEARKNQVVGALAMASSGLGISIFTFLKAYFSGKP